MSRLKTSELLKKKALDALLETMDRTYPHADPNYSKPFGEKGTEMDSNHTDQVTIPAKDIRASSPVIQNPKLQPPESVEDATFFKESDPSMNPVEEEKEEHSFFKEAPEFEMVRASASRPAYVVKKANPGYILQDISKLLSKYGYTYTGPFTDGSIRYSKGRDEYVMVYPQTETFAHFVDGTKDLEGKLSDIEDRVSYHHGFERPVMASQKFASKNVPDPGAGKYDFEHEAHVRDEIKDWAEYAEEEDNTEHIKPYDPAGEYLCGTCDMRKGDSDCMRVESPINFETGSCRLFHWDGGNPPETDPPMKGKFTHEEAKYSEHEGGFSCKRCEYGSEAAEADPDGRPSWCSFWGTHVIPTACCSEWDEDEEKDKKLVQIEAAWHIKKDEKPISGYGAGERDKGEGPEPHRYQGYKDGSSCYVCGQKRDAEIHTKDGKTAAGAYLYHVTHTSNVPSIQKDGLKPMQTSNWEPGDKSEEHYGGGEIFAFEHPNDAVKWGGKMDWEFNKSMGTGKISIVVISKSGKGRHAERWVVDKNDPISQMGSSGKWLKTTTAIPPDRIVKVVPVKSDLIRQAVSGEEVKIASTDGIKKLWREFVRTYPGTADEEKFQMNLHKIGHFILMFKAELEELTANGSMFDTDAKWERALGRVKEAENLWDRGNYPVAVRLTRWAFEVLIPEAKVAGVPELNRKEQFEKLQAKWVALKESIGWPANIHGKDMTQMAKKIPIIINFADSLEALKPEGKALFEDADVSFNNTTDNLRKGKERLTKVLKYLPEVTDKEWAHRSEYSERDLAWWFDAGIGDIDIGFHNLGVEYMHIDDKKSASTKSYGMGTPIGGTPNVPADNEDEPDDKPAPPATPPPVVAAAKPKCPHCGSKKYALMPTDFETAKCDDCGKTWDHGIVDGINNPYEITASFSITAADFMPMFQTLVQAKPDLEPEVKGEIAWAKSHLRKNDRITWYLRWVRLYLERRWAGGKLPAIKKMFDKDIASYSKKNPIRVEDIPNDMKGIREKLDHWLSLTDKAVQDKVFAYETFGQLAQDFTKLEADIAERQENERRIVKQNEDDEDEVFIEFPDGWRWVWLKRASCDAESAAMGHCGNSPRSDTDDTILSLRQPVTKGGKTYWSPHLTFILDARHVVGEMKGRNNQKPTRKYHPYIIALFKDQRIKGIKGGGYKPENNFKLGDLTDQQRKEIQDANPAIFAAPTDVESMAEAMGLDSGAWDNEHKLFIVREWSGMRSMVNDLGNGEAEQAMDWAMDGDQESGVEIDMPHTDDVASDLSNNLSLAAMRNIGARLMQEDEWVVQEYCTQSRTPFPPDFADPRVFEGLMSYVGNRAPHSGTWLSVIDSYRQGRENKYRSYRVGDLEYLIEHDVYENSDKPIYTEFRYGKDFSTTLDWKARPVYEVITYSEAQRLLEDEDVDRDISNGMIGELYLYEASYDDDREDEEANDLLDRWYREGFDREADPNQMKFDFQSSLLRRKAFVPVKETPRFLPQRDDMRRHIDQEAQDQVMEGVMDGVKPNQPRQRPEPRKPQIDPNAHIDPATMPSGDIKPNPDMVSLTSALEGEVLPKRADFWNLYVYNPAGKLTGTYYVTSKQEGVQRVSEMFGFLNHNEENELYRVGRLNLYDGREPVAVVCITKWPKPPAVEPLQPMGGLDVYAAQKEAGPLTKAVLPIALSLGMTPGMRAEQPKAPVQPQEQTSIQVEPAPGETIIDKSEGDTKVITAPEPEVPGVIKPVSPDELQKRQVRRVLIAAEMPEDEQAREFLDKVEAAEDEARQAFMVEPYLQQEAQDAGMTMDELWAEIGQEYANEYFAAKDDRLPR